MSGNLDVDGTTNLDAVDIDGAVQIDGAVSIGVNDTGKDVKLYGATSGAYIEWDESDDELRTVGSAVLDVVKDKLLIGGSAVTTTAAELNLLDAGARTASTYDMASGASFTVDAAQQSITITLNANLGDDASLSEITISNTSVLATSVVIASSSAGPVTINEVASGSFKCIIKNTTGSQINDDATLVLNWVVI